MGERFLTRRTFLAAAGASGLTLLSGRASAGALVVGSEDYPPYAFNYRGQRKGYDVEKVTAVLDELRMLPVQRAMDHSALFDGLNESSVAMAFPFVETAERKAKYIYLGPLHVTRTVFAMRTGEAKEPITLDSLANLRVSVVSGHRYPDAFEALTNITRVPTPSMILALRRLTYGRVDAVIGDYSSLREMVTTEGLSRQITVSSNVLVSRAAYALAPKSQAAFAHEFAEVLRKLQSNGRFKALDEKYPSVEPPRSP
jgi:polar amino acid transport system substrate-binding protein